MIDKKINTPIYYDINNNSFNSKLVFKNRTNKYIYYQCNLRNQCKGAAKIDIENKKLLITQNCNTEIEHNKIEYEEFVKKLEDNDIKLINFKEKYIQKYYIQYSIYKDNSIDNPTLKKNFFNLTKEKLNITLSMITNIRNKIVSNYKDLSLEELVKKIDLKNLNYNVYSTDIKYSYEEKKNKMVERSQKIILFGLSEQIKLLNKKETLEFFLDITYKIIPSKFRPYKLIVLAGLPNNKNNEPVLITFILMKYIDNKALEILFNYLYENFDFQPKILHTDFDKAIYLAIKNNIHLKDTIHSKCLFHFSQMVRKRLKKIGYCKNKLNKNSIEIIRNIELLAFIKKKNILP